jgi:Zn-dependent protease
LDFTYDQFQHVLLFLIALILSIGVHEFGHAWVASRLGDSLPRAQGRLTLNPVAHIDPIGTLLFPLVLGLAPGGMMFGWGRPVQTNPSSYTRAISRPTGSMLVSIAGPGMNLVMAILVSAVIVVGMRFGFMSAELGTGLFSYLVRLNLILLFFNLLPIPPLDGGAVLAWVLPRSMQGVIDFLSRWGFLILIGLMMTPALRWLMTPGYIVIHMWELGLRRLIGA